MYGWRSLRTWRLKSFFFRQLLHKLIAKMMLFILLSRDGLKRPALAALIERQLHLWPLRTLSQSSFGPRPHPIHHNHTAVLMSSLKFRVTKICWLVEMSSYRWVGLWDLSGSVRPRASLRSHDFGWVTHPYPTKPCHVASRVACLLFI